MTRYAGVVVCMLAVGCGGNAVLERGSDGGGGSGRASGGAGGQTAAQARAAVTIKVGVTSGKVCAHTSPQVSTPQNVAGVIEALSCDLSTGCKPDEYVVVDHDRGVNVQCMVAPNGDTFNVAASLSVDGTSTATDSLSLQLTGVLSPTGGMVSISEQNSQAKGGGTGNTCQVLITPPRGLVKRGAIWGTVHCDAFRDPTDFGETGCALDGMFLFENCAG